MKSNGSQSNTSSGEPMVNAENFDLDALTHLQGPKRVGISLLVAVFGVFGIWSALAPLDSAAYAPGTVTVKSYKKIVQHLEGGIVAKILAQDGDQVEAGQPLLILDDTQSKASLEIVSGQYVSLLMREARLIAERDGLAAVSYPEIEETDSNNFAKEMTAQNQIFSARLAMNFGRTEILEQRINQLNNQVIGMEASRDAKALLADSFADELSDTKSLLEKGFSDKEKLRLAERSFASFSGEAAELSANIAATRMQIGEAELQILQQQSEFQSEVVAELSDVQIQLKDVRERLRALQDIVSRTTIVSPDSGIVNGMQVHTVGGVISPASPIAEIVPKSDELIVEASVNPIDIDRVAEGQETRIRFSTFGNRAPTIFGKLLSLSADAIPTETNGLSYYRARIEVNSESLEELGELTLVPGMPAEVFINTGSRTLLQYLFKPLSNAVARSLNED